MYTSTFFLLEKKQLYRITISACLGLEMGFLLYGQVVGYFKNNKNCATQYQFVNPEPDCETLEATIGRLDRTEDSVRNTVDQLLKEGKVRRVSVFARDLTTLRYVAVNEWEMFEPASLMKIPLLMAYYQYAELDPAFLSQRVVYEGGDDLNKDQQMQTFDEQTQLAAGQEYPIENLLERMIKYSDNNATHQLQKWIAADYLERVLMDLGLRIPKHGMNDNRDFVTTKSFAAIFRYLYNSSVLNRKSSEQVLAVLSQTTFDQGIRAVIPKDVKLVEKYGERSVYDQSGSILTRELHECGIVYSKASPFTFCVFTEGDSFENLTESLQTITKKLYEDMSKKY